MNSSIRKNDRSQSILEIYEFRSPFCEGEFLFDVRPVCDLQSPLFDRFRFGGFSKFRVMLLRGIEKLNIKSRRVLKLVNDPRSFLRDSRFNVFK